MIGLEPTRLSALACGGRVYKILVVLRGLFSNPPEPLADLLSWLDLIREEPKRKKRRPTT